MPCVQQPLSETILAGLLLQLTQQVPSTKYSVTYQYYTNLTACYGYMVFMIQNDTTTQIVSFCNVQEDYIRVGYNPWRQSPCNRKATHSHSQCSSSNSPLRQKTSRDRYQHKCSRTISGCLGDCRGQPG